MAYVKTMAELAKALGVAERTVRVYKDAGCPMRKVKRGYSVDAVRKWLADRNGKTAQARADPLLRKTKELKLERELERLQMQRWEHELKRGQFVALDVVKRMFRARIREWRRQALLIPRGAAPSLVGKASAQEVERTLRRYIVRMLEVMAEFTREDDDGIERELRRNTDHRDE